MKKLLKLFLMCAISCIFMCSCSDEDIDGFFDDLQEDLQETESLEGNSDGENNESDAVFYSTNDYETAKKGNSGMFSYKSKDGSYDVYWILDLDNSYAYYFTEGNDNGFCDKIKITSGDINLNDVITITWNDSGEQWFLHFKYIEHPETLIVIDHFGNPTTFAATDLAKAREIRGNKLISEK